MDMKLSTRGRYGLRIMLELALNHGDRLMTVRGISEHQGISEKYIEQIISSLNKAGLVRSFRGAAGGYRLAYRPADITVGQVLRATEGDLSVAECTAGSFDCPRRGECVTIEVWSEIKAAIEQVVDNITLSQLTGKYHRSCNLADLAIK